MKSEFALITVGLLLSFTLAATSYRGRGNTLSYDTEPLAATTSVKVRSGPCTDTSTKTVLQKGDKIEYTGKSVSGCGYTWLAIQGPQFDGIGYAASNYFTSIASKSAPTAQSPSSYSTGGEESCGQAYSGGQKLGEMNCVRRDGKLVVTSTAAAYDSMKKAAAADGVDLRINSGFRTNKEQEYFYNCYLTKQCNNGNKAAKPGTSNHQNGVALDIHMNDAVYDWLRNNVSFLLVYLFLGKQVRVR
jgi:hypothetical protein